MHYVPIGTFLFLVLWLLLAGLVVLFETGVLQHVYASLGISRRYMFTLLVLSLLGSYINIPVALLPAQQVHSNEIVSFFGMPYVIPMVIGGPGRSSRSTWAAP